MEVLDKAGLQYYNSLIEDKYLKKTGGTVTGDIYGVTASPNDNSTKLATTEYVQSALNGGSLDDYLPLSGGTMTGTIEREGDTTVNTNDTSWTRFSGGTAYAKGGHIILYGMSNSNNPGQFTIGAHNGTTSKSLIGRPDGTLTWGGNKVATFDSNNKLVFPDGTTVWIELPTT